MVFNGEIYNYREIRAELLARGHQFRSDSDSEVILVAYREWGIECVSRFRGMFAFALWDDELKTLHLCRDRFGVKPLFYSLCEGRLSFASEIKALHAVGDTGTAVDPVALAEYVQYGYVNAPRTLFQSVRSVMPGTVLSFDARLRQTEREYWSIHRIFDREESQALRVELASLGDEALLDRMEGELRTAFEYRMVADVPVGLFLSGGIDSSLVAGVLARRSGVHLRTFTIGYESAEFDETEYARRVAKHLGAEHTEFIVSADEALKLFDRIPAIADEPIGDSSIIPTLMVSQLAVRHVKVALSADGADELFGGYARYDICGRYVDRLGTLARTGQWLSAEVLDLIPPAWLSSAYATAMGGRRRFAAIDDKLRKFVAMSRASSPFAAYEAAISEWSAKQRSNLGVRSELAEALAAKAFDATRPIDARTAFMHFDASRYLTGDLLTKVDRASMAVSLEAREPFLDHEMAKVAAALPTHWKIRDGKNKYILRRLLDRHFEPGLFDRPKQGFSAPIAQWLRGPLREVVRHELSPANVRRFGLLDPAGVDKVVTGFLQGRPGASAAGVWFLLQLQQWAGRWLQAAPPLSAAQAAPAAAMRSSAG
jgi:asparagine synthase (glutamine-hydrolysing)